MAATSSSSSYKLRALSVFISRYRAVAGGSWRSHHTHHHDLPPHKVGGGGSVDQGLRCLSVNSSRETNQSEGIPEKQQIPSPPKFALSNWVKWFMGSVVTFLLPFWKNKWDNLLTLEAKAAKVMGEVEAVAEVVEKVATAADKALEGVVNELPDNSKLKEAAQELEHVSINVAAHDAQIIENIINKVSDVKQDLEDLESIVEPIVDKLIQGKHTKKIDVNNKKYKS